MVFMGGFFGIYIFFSFDSNAPPLCSYELGSIGDLINSFCFSRKNERRDLASFFFSFTFAVKLKLEKGKSKSIWKKTVDLYQ